MTPRLRRTIGFLIILTSIAGIAFTVYLGFRVWLSKSYVTDNLLSNLSLAEEMVSTSSDMLVLVDNTLVTASSELDIVGESLLTLTNTIHDAGPLVDSLQTLTGNDLPATIEATQKSLDTAQQSAEIIDNLLRTISRIPFFPGDPYNPEIPLSDSLGQISASLDSITPSMKSIQSDLVSTQDDIAEINTYLTEISNSAAQIQQNLSDAQVILNDYQDQFLKVESRLNKAKVETPSWVSRIVSAMIFLLAWFGIAQLALLFQGIGYLLEK